MTDLDQMLLNGGVPLSLGGQVLKAQGAIHYDFTTMSDGAIPDTLLEHRPADSGWFAAGIEDGFLRPVDPDVEVELLGIGLFHIRRSVIYREVPWSGGWVSTLVLHNDTQQLNEHQCGPGLGLGPWQRPTLAALWQDYTIGTIVYANMASMPLVANFNDPIVGDPYIPDSDSHYHQRLRASTTMPRLAATDGGSFVGNNLNSFGQLHPQTIELRWDGTKFDIHQNGDRMYGPMIPEPDSGLDDLDTPTLDLFKIHTTSLLPPWDTLIGPVILLPNSNVSVRSWTLAPLNEDLGDPPIATVIASTKGLSATGSITPTYPTMTGATDLIVFIATNTAGGLPVISPTGFTSAGGLRNGAVQLHAWRKTVVSGGESGSMPTWNKNSGTGLKFLAVSITNGHPITRGFASDTASGTVSTSLPVVTDNVTGPGLLALWATVIPTSQQVTAPAGFSILDQFGLSDGFNLAVAVGEAPDTYASVETFTTTGNVASAAAEWVAMTVLKEPDSR